jgi:hypothetical protein
VTAIVGKLVTSEDGELHVETVDDASIIRSVCQKGDSRVEGMDYFGLLNSKLFKMLQAIESSTTLTNGTKAY